MTDGLTDWLIDWLIDWIIDWRTQDSFHDILFVPLPLSCRRPFSRSLATTALKELEKSSNALEMEYNSILPSDFTAAKWSSCKWFWSTQSLFKLHLNLQKRNTKSPHVQTPRDGNLTGNIWVRLCWKDWKTLIIHIYSRLSSVSLCNSILDSRSANPAPNLLLFRNPITVVVGCF